jgi:hypothetical protein
MGDNIRKIETGDNVRKMETGDNVRKIEMGDNVRKIEMGNNVRKIEMGNNIRKNSRHPRESGDPFSSVESQWIPAEACPRMLESGAGMTILKLRASCTFAMGNKVAVQMGFANTYRPKR